MKLLVLTAGLESSTLDPAATWMHDLSARLAIRGHRVTVLCTREQDAREPPEDPPGVKVWRSAERDLPAVLSALLDLSPDVVHVAGTGPLEPPVLAALASAPLLIDLLDWSAICPAGDLLARPNGDPCALHHPVAPCGACVGHSRVKAMEPFMAFARGGHRVVAHASHVRDRATPVLGRGIALVPAGVDATRFTPTPSPALTPEVAALASDRTRPRVVVLGPPTPARGGARLLDLLVALHARAPESELVVGGTDTGNPDLFHILLAEAKELGVASHLKTLPRVAPAELPALLAACDVAVSPGIAPEPLGLSTVQALAVGLPVVAHGEATARELLQDGAAGVLAAAGSMAPFADAVARLLDDRAARVAIGERARLAALEHHDVERAVFDTEAIYERVRGLHAMRLSSAPPRQRREAA